MCMQQTDSFVSGGHTFTYDDQTALYAIQYRNVGEQCPLLEPKAFKKFKTWFVMSEDVAEQ